MAVLDLAAFYAVKTAWLNQQARKNAGRFPENFALM